MAEKNSAPDVEYNDDGTKNPDYVAPKTGSEGADDTKNKVADDKGKDDKGGEGAGDGEAEFDDTIDPAKPPQIPIRKSVEQHIINRQSKKVKKLESKLKEGDEGYVAPTADDDEGDDDEGGTGATDTKKVVESEVKKAIAPLLGKLASDADEGEMRELISSDPEAKKYVNHIKAYMEHDAYKGVSPAVIYHHLAWTAAQALGAKKKKAADFNANQHKGGGNTIVDKGTVGDLPSAEDIANMSEADFAEMENKALRGGFLKK